MAEGDELPGGGGVRGHTPLEIFSHEYALRCNLVHFETHCALTLSRLDDFSDIVSFIL